MAKVDIWFNFSAHRCELNGRIVIHPGTEMTLNKRTDPCWSKTATDEAIAVTRKAHDLDLHRFDETFLAKALNARQIATSCNSPDAYVTLLANDKAEAETLLRSLHISYSEFFRNPFSFTLLEQLILPALCDAHEASRRSEIRIWSAGCAAGQEAWSIAILLDELIEARGNSCSCRILASDLSGPDLTLARAGVYHADDLGNLRLRHLHKYFSRQGENFTVVPQLRKRITFSAHDLLDENTICPPESIFGNFDLVLCSNVLLYYRPEVQRFIISKAHRCLTPGGYLVTDDSERQIVEGAGGFRWLFQPAPIFQAL